MDLVRIYDPGDRIYLFGFSRGAFTVRTVAGLIAKCGVLDRDNLPTTDALRKTVAKAYSTYRRSYRTWLGQLIHSHQRDLDAMQNFKQTHSLPGDVRTPLHRRMGHRRRRRRTLSFERSHQRHLPPFQISRS